MNRTAAARKWRVAAGLCLLALLSPPLYGCETGISTGASVQSVEQVLDEHRKAIMALPQVVGTGLSQCGDELCIRVLVTGENPGLRQQVIAIIGDVPFELQLTEPLQAR